MGRRSGGSGHIDEKKLQTGARFLLEGMGVDLNDPNFKGTPARVAKMYRELLSPKESRWAVFPARQSDLILLRGHRVVALCPHHLLPVELTAAVGYIPNDKVVGLSKLARVVEVQLVRPIMQEDLAHDIAAALDEQLKPKGVGVVLAGTHGCMRLRGVQTDGDIVTSVMRGVLLLNPNARQEFLSLVGRYTPHG